MGHNQERELSRILSQIFIDKLAVIEIDQDENFFDLGCNSLMIIEVNSTLYENTGLNVLIEDYFKFPTLNKLSKAIYENYDLTELKSRQDDNLETESEEEYQPLTKPE